MTERPGDWMKSPAFLANVGHVLAGLCTVLLASLYARSRFEVEAVTAGLVAAALFKEYVVDLVYESGETVWTSTVDFAGYMVGASAGWVNLWLAARLGH